MTGNIVQNKDGGDKSDFIQLKVVSQDGNEIQFRVKMATLMGKLKKSYAERLGIKLDSVRFLFDGQRINDDHTPKKLEMESGDVIEVVVKQEGGEGCQ